MTDDTKDYEEVDVEGEFDNEAFLPSEDCIPLTETGREHPREIVEESSSRLSSSNRSILAIILLISLSLGVQFLFKFQSTPVAIENQSLSQITNATIEIKKNYTLTKWIHKSKDLVSEIPTEQNPKQKPFVFFHIRKGGGSILRSIIFQASKSLKLTTWIACNSLPCVPFSLPPGGKKFDVYGAHLNYVHMTQVFTEVGDYQKEVSSKELVKVKLDNSTEVALGYKRDEDYSHFNCLTNLRPTVSRVVSCWNFRMKQTGSNTWRLPYASDMSPVDWDNLLPNMYDQFGNGCNNEIYRDFGSTVDEPSVNNFQPITEDDENGHCFLQEFEKTAARLSKCVIIMLHRCEESKQILSHYLPWLNIANGQNDLCNENASGHNTGKTDDSKKILQPNASDAILHQNQMDEMLYTFGESLFEEQLKIATEAAVNMHK